MLELMSEGTRAHLLAFLSKKKVAFLVLLYERMIPELRSFCLAESRDFSIFQRAREDFWRFLADDNSSISWPQLTQDILDAIPSSEDFGTLEGSFALNAGLLAAETAGFIGDGEDQHIVDATQYAFDSIDFKVQDTLKLEIIGFYDRSVVSHVHARVLAHPLITRERQIEEEDVSFLTTLPDGQWPSDLLAMLRHRAESRRGLLASLPAKADKVPADSALVICSFQCGTISAAESEMRKGEVIKRRIDRDFPHQVTILFPEGGLVARLMAMHQFCTTHAMPYVTCADVRHDEGSDYVRFCFADPAHADAFLAQFGGDPITIEPH